MTKTQQIFRGSFLMGIIALASACVVSEPREGYYDRDHHRYWQEHGWHECGDHEDRCR